MGVEEVVAVHLDLEEAVLVEAYEGLVDATRTDAVFGAYVLVVYADLLDDESEDDFAPDGLHIDSAVFPDFVPDPVEGLCVGMDGRVRGQLSTEGEEDGEGGVCLVKFIAVLRREVYATVAEVDVNAFAVGVDVGLDFVVEDFLVGVASINILVAVGNALVSVVEVGYVGLITSSDDVTHKDVLTASLLAKNRYGVLLEFFDYRAESHMKRTTFRMTMTGSEIAKVTRSAVRD